LLIDNNSNNNNNNNNNKLIIIRIDQLGQRFSWPVSSHCPCNCLEKPRRTTTMCAVHVFFPYQYEL